MGGRTGGDVRAVSMGGSSLAIAVFSLEHILFRMLSLEKGPTVISVWNGLVMGGPQSPVKNLLAVLQQQHPTSNGLGREK